MTPAAPTATAEEIKDANVRYHDVAATDYDVKWGIDLGEIGQSQVRAKLAKALGEWPERPFGDALEIGAGTGYFTLNLLSLGAIERATATDISQGMLDSLAASAGRIGVRVETARAEAEELPFEDDSFDLVCGHAIVHHIPRLERAFDEFRRVLRPGGTIAFCGEPSRNGDRLASIPKRAGMVAAPAWRRLVGVPARPLEPASNCHGHHLEGDVDVHTFTPDQLQRLLDGAGFVDSRLRGEELASNAYGWLLRSLEATADPDELPLRWRVFAYRTCLALQKLDAAVLEPHLPPGLFYNLVFSARKPG
jgi:ubiquinone/menaquinone biosynthesis C-methylase UbiE